jgi:hypothetical protein
MPLTCRDIPVPGHEASSRALVCLSGAEDVRGSFDSGSRPLSRRRTGGVPVREGSSGGGQPGVRGARSVTRPFAELGDPGPRRWSRPQPGEPIPVAVADYLEAVGFLDAARAAFVFPQVPRRRSLGLLLSQSRRPPPLRGGPAVSPFAAGPVMDADASACLSVGQPHLHEPEVSPPAHAAASQVPEPCEPFGSRSPSHPLSWGVATTTRTEDLHHGASSPRRLRPRCSVRASPRLQPRNPYPRRRASGGGITWP